MRGESTSEQEDDSEADFVETDPTRRYHRGRKVLGKGAFKKVYWAFDELEGIEVAWNQIKISELLRKAEDLERLYSEVHLLKTLKHKHIIKFHHSWVDTKNEHINFITEIFTSGTLRQYRMKHKRVDLRALKKWSKQILEGLQYLHGRDPPIIHRDLKCDNIFVNGNHGELKIGDLGLAAILHHANGAHSVIGTPEFMAPELYEEEYNELVDIYAFGMCLLELVTFEYPYTECANAAQIYKKVTSGIKPASLAKVMNPDVKDFIERCITDVSKRLSAKDLLNDPFLADVSPESTAHSSHVNIPHLDSDSETVQSIHNKPDINKKKLLDNPNPGLSRDLTVQGERQDVKTVYIKLRIADSTDKYRNIHFPFDIEADTSIAVASEMVHELDLTDQDITTIADMIDSEVRALMPDWSPKDSSGGDSPFDSPTTNDPKEDSSPHNVIENKDDTSPLSNASPFSTGGVFPDQLPSGRKFWSDSPKDSPKAGGGMSSIEPSPNSPSEATDEVFQNESSQISIQDFETDKTAGGPIGEILIENTDETYAGSMSNKVSKHEHGSSGLPPKSPRNFHLGSDDGDMFHGKKSLGSSSEENCYSKKDDSAVPCIQNEEGNNSGHLGNSDNVENYEGKSYTESDLKAIADTLDELLAQQQKQLEELKLNHKLAISHVLKDLPPQLHPKVFNSCSTKMISHMPNAGGYAGVGDSNQVPLKRIFTRSLSTIDLSTTKANIKKDSTSEMGIAVILKKDSEEP